MTLRIERHVVTYIGTSDRDILDLLEQLVDPDFFQRDDAIESIEICIEEYKDENEAVPPEFYNLLEILQNETAPGEDVTFYHIREDE